MEGLTSLSDSWATLVLAISLSALAYWIKNTLKDSGENMLKEIRGLSEKLAAEIAVHAHERQVGGAMEQVHQQHVVENSVEHERIIESLEHLTEEGHRQTELMSKQFGKQNEMFSNQFTKQTEVLAEIAASLRFKS